MRALTVGIFCAVLCGGCGDSDAPPAVSIALTSDGSHACAGVVNLRVTVSEVGGDPIENEVPAAVAPEQLDCDFDVGVAEALYGLHIGELETGRPHTAKVEMFDSTGLLVAAGASEPFEPKPRDVIDPVDIELTRVAPIGTVLFDLLAEPDFALQTGELSIVVLAGIEPIGSRSIDWPGDTTMKRPLRISGLLGIGLRLMLTLEDSAGSELASGTTEAFSLGSSENDAFESPQFE